MKSLSKFVSINLKKVLLIVIDFIVIYLSFVISLNFFGQNVVATYTYIISVIILLLVYFDCLFISGIYDIILKYATVKDYILLFALSLLSQIVSFLILSLILNIHYYFKFMIFSALLSSTALIVIRMLYQIFSTRIHKDKNATYERLMLVGAGNAASIILGQIKTNSRYSPVCIVDDNKLKLNRKLKNVKIVGNTDSIPEFCNKYLIDKILFCIPSCTTERKNHILNICLKTGLDVIAVPSLPELLVDTKSRLIDQAHEVGIQDLLEREPLEFDIDGISKLIYNKICLVTGGGGSIGSELCRQIAKYNPAKLIILDINENNVYEIQQELLEAYKDKINLSVEIASVRDKEKMEILFNFYRPQIIFHAAAHKHVPLMETNPEEAIKNNIFGTYNVLSLCTKYDIEKFVLISSDKAVNPTNAMGATKRYCEMMVQYFSQKNYKTDFLTVRFGNVLDSNGSVIPLFKKQIAKGGPVTVTHKDVIRYFMTIQEAVSLVLQAGCFANDGEIFILNMGKPVKILDLAENMIKLYGYEPYTDINIKFIGLRPGEKLYEELLMKEEGLSSTSHNKIFKSHQINIDDNEMENSLKKLERISHSENKEKIFNVLSEVVKSYTHK